MQLAAVKYPLNLIGADAHIGPPPSAPPVGADAHIGPPSPASPAGPTPRLPIRRKIIRMADADSAGPCYDMIGELKTKGSAAT